MKRATTLVMLSLWAGTDVAAASGDRGFAWPGELDTLAEGLDSDLPAKRQAAVARLAPYALGLIAPYVEPLLDDPDPHIRAEAMRILAQGGDTHMLPRALQRLGDADPEVRRQAIIALGEFDQAQAAGALTRILASTEPGERLAALAALMRPAHVRQPGLAASLAPLLRDPKTEIREAAARAAAQLASPALLLPLTVLTNDNSAAVRREACIALGAIADPRATPALVRLLDGQPEDIELAALDALINVATPEATAAVVSRWPQRSPASQHKRALALAAIARRAARSADREVAISHLVNRLTSDPHHSIDAAVLSLGELAVPALANALRQRGRLQPEIAVQLLGKLDAASAAPALLDELARDRVNPVLVLEALGRTRAPHAFQAIWNQLESQEPDIRIAALKALLSLEPVDPRLPELLITLLDDAPEFTALAIEGLGLHGHRLPAATDKLLDMLKRHQHGTGALAVINALGQVGAAKSVPALIALRDSGPVELQRPAALALARHHANDDDLRDLQRSLTTRPTTAIVHRLLAVLGSTHTYPFYARLAANGGALSGQVAIAASYIHAQYPQGEGSATLRRLAQQAHGDERCIALRALGLATDEASGRILTATAQQPDVAAATCALWALTARPALALHQGALPTWLIRLTLSPAWSVATNASALVAELAHTHAKLPWSPLLTPHATQAPTVRANLTMAETWRRCADAANGEWTLQAHGIGDAHPWLRRAVQIVVANCPEAPASLRQRAGGAPHIATAPVTRIWEFVNEQNAPVVGATYAVLAPGRPIMTVASDANGLVVVHASPQAVVVDPMLPWTPVAPR